MSRHVVPADAGAVGEEIGRLLGDAGQRAAGSEEALRERVAVTAASLFLARGISSVRMTDVAEAAGVGVATLYRRFSTKTNVVVAAGELLWRRFNLRIHHLVESNDFLALDGAARLETLLREYATRYAANRAFVCFLDDFDHMVIAEGLGEEDLAVYGGEVDSFYLIFEDAYQLGRSDGTISREVDFGCYYRAVAHALVGVAVKLARGEVIPSDDFSEGARELDCIVDMAVRALRRA